MPFLGAFLGQNLITWAITAGIFGGMFIVVSIINFIPTKKLDANPSRYMQNKGNGNVIVNPMGNTNWTQYVNWIRLVLEERVSDGILQESVTDGEDPKGQNHKQFCGKCGTKAIINETYCRHCGEVL